MPVRAVVLHCRVASATAVDCYRGRGPDRGHAAAPHSLTIVRLEGPHHQLPPNDWLLLTKIIRPDKGLHACDVSTQRLYWLSLRLFIQRVRILSAYIDCMRVSMQRLDWLPISSFTAIGLLISGTIRDGIAKFAFAIGKIAEGLPENAHIGAHRCCLSSLAIVADDDNRS